MAALYCIATVKKHLRMSAGSCNHYVSLVSRTSFPSWCILVSIGIAESVGPGASRIADVADPA